MQDDTYLIVDAGWEAAAKPVRLEAKSKDRVDFTVDKVKFKSDLIPAELLIARFFSSEHDAVQQAEAAVAAAGQALDDLYEEHGGDEGLLVELFGEKTRIARKDVAAKLKDKSLEADEKTALREYLDALDAESAAKEALRTTEEDLNEKAAAKYGNLTKQEIQTLVIDDKWIRHIASAADTELQRLASTLSGRIKELAARYERPLDELTALTARLSSRVNEHLRKLVAT
jgi:type I restriction enzyme M protein